MDKDVKFFKQKEDSVKRQCLDSTREFQQHFRSIVKASHVVSFISLYCRAMETVHHLQDSH